MKLSPKAIFQLRITYDWTVGDFSGGSRLPVAVPPKGKHYRYGMLS